MRLASLALLVACTNQTSVGDAPVGDTGDLDDSGDVEQVGDDSGDSGADTAEDTAEDTGEEVYDGDLAGPATFTFLIDGATDADSVQVEWMTEDWTGLDGTAGGGPIVDGTATLELAPPEAADLHPVPDVPGLWYRYALPFAYVDEDAGGAHETGEPVRGAGVVWPIFFAGELPAQLVAAGFVDGWNAVVLDPWGRTDRDAVPLALLPDPILTARLAGTVSYDPDASYRLAVLPSVAFEGAFNGDLVYDEGLEGPWEIAVEGAPDADHLADLSGNGVWGALEVPIVYDDDGDHAVEEREIVGPACSGTAVAALLWVAEPGDPFVAYYQAVSGTTPGWYTVRSTTTGDLELMDEDSATNLLIGGSCSF